MKNLLKSLSISIVILAFACSDEQNINSMENSEIEYGIIEATEVTIAKARGRAMHTIIVECPGSSTTFGPTCPHDLDPSITIYNVYQSPNCPDVYMVWVDTLEYEAIYGPPPTTGTTHLLTPPYVTQPPEIWIDVVYPGCF